jgi:hypothetical protein
MIAATRMAGRLTVPFARGADTLDLRLTLFSSSQATVVKYDFGDHLARFGVSPEPRYVLASTRDIAVDTAVSLLYEEPGGEQKQIDVQFPAGTVAGTSVLLDQPITATARVFFLSMAPTPDDNAPQECWTLTALLGNSAKLLWVVGAERDQLRRHGVRALAQRHLPTATGLSLDVIGADLGIPRFPPLPYGFDTDTVALYHLDDTDGVAAVDATGAYPGRTKHPGTLGGPVQVGVPGRYGRAMGFPAAGATVTVPADPVFDIGGGRFDGATMECFVRPDAGADPEDVPVLSRNSEAGSGIPGWTIAIGRLGRGIARNVRFTISDGDGDGDGDDDIDLFADVSLPTDGFSHIAAVVDRQPGVVALYVDGVRRDWRFVTFGAVTSGEPVVIGGGFVGVVDEVRISSVACAGFAPALGEDDDHYRRRLELFRRWTLPTPANLAALLNELVGPIGGGTDALLVDDTNARLVRGTRLVRVRPHALLPGESIDAAGRRNVAEETAVGTAGAEDAFDPAYLLPLDRTDVDFALPGPHPVQVGVADRLDRLIALVDAEPGQSGRLVVDATFDPRADDLRATGRAVLLRHTAVGADRVAALAHRAGFDYVSYRAGVGQVYAAAALGDYFTIDAAGAVDAGGTVSLALRPPPPSDAVVKWLVLPDGLGRGTLTPDGGPASPHPTAALAATAPGRLIAKVDLTRGRHTVSATQELRVGLADLLDGSAITADGAFGEDPSSLDDPDPAFNPAFLLKRDGDTRADYGTDDARTMQPAVFELLDALLDELDRRAVAGRLLVVSAFQAGAATDHPDQAAAEGRELVLRHSTLAPGALAGPAFAVGFGRIANAGDTLVLTQAPGQFVAVRGPATDDRAAIIEVDEGGAMDLTVSPRPQDLLAGGLAGPVPTEAPRLTWASGTYDEAQITLGSSSEQTVSLLGGTAGMAWVQASYLIGGAPAPYTFEVRLRPELDTAPTVITKDQHDLIMNILNALHPVGVEVITAAIRAHVIELQDPQAPANPDYTYPKFRVRGTLPPQVRRPADG